MCNERDSPLEPFVLPVLPAYLNSRGSSVAPTWAHLCWPGSRSSIHISDKIKTPHCSLCGRSPWPAGFLHKGPVMRKEHWKPRVAMMRTLSLLEAPQAVMTTTCGILSDDKFRIMTTLGFRRNYFRFPPHLAHHDLSWLQLQACRQVITGGAVAVRVFSKLLFEGFCLPALLHYTRSSWFGRCWGDEVDGSKWRGHGRRVLVTVGVSIYNQDIGIINKVTHNRDRDLQDTDPKSRVEIIFLWPCNDVPESGRPGSDTTSHVYGFCQNDTFCKYRAHTPCCDIWRMLCLLSWMNSGDSPHFCSKCKNHNQI